VAPAEAIEAAPLSLEPAVGAPPLALDTDQLPAALTWEGRSKSEAAELPPELAEPRRMRFSWRQLLPRLIP